jgi:glycosyltransferase involved in cell wall biosynthesis
VLPSQWEGFGIALAEALSCGTPCITSNRAPMTEIVRDGECGLLCDPNSVESIEATLERAITTAGLREGLAANARAASEPYETQRIEGREAGLYCWCIGGNRPMVSVVLPTFNRCRLVEAAVRNVLSQDYANLELIVVNDGSSDGTKELLVGLKHEINDSRLQVIHKPNGGLPEALNSGFAHATGKYFTWTSDDNAYRPGAISAMVRELELDQEAVMVFANYREIRDDGTPGNVKITGPASDLNRRNTIGACFLYRREAARQVGEYDAKLELAEDFDYWVRLAKVGKLVHLARTLYDYGDSPDSLSRLRATGVAEAAAKIVERQGSPQAVHDHMVTLAGEYKRHGQPLRSLGVSLSLIARYPLSRAGYWAAARALTPMPLLRMTRRMRGLDGRA